VVVLGPVIEARAVKIVLDSTLAHRDVGQLVDLCDGLVGLLQDAPVEGANLVVDIVVLPLQPHHFELFWNVHVFDIRGVWPGQRKTSSPSVDS